MKHCSIFYKPIFSISSSSMPHILCFTNNNVQTKLLVTSHNTSVHRDTDRSRGVTSQVQDLNVAVFRTFSDGVICVGNGCFLGTAQ